MATGWDSSLHVSSGRSPLYARGPKCISSFSNKFVSITFFKMTARGLKEFVVERIMSYLLPELESYRNLARKQFPGSRCCYCGFPVIRHRTDFCCAGCGNNNICEEDWCIKESRQCNHCQVQAIFCKICVKQQCTFPGCTQIPCRRCRILGNCRRCNKQICKSHFKSPKTVLPGDFVIWGNISVCPMCIEAIDVVPREGLGRCVTCYQKWLDAGGTQKNPQCIHK